MNLVEYAKSFIGKVSYSFGSTDIENGKADCSSFVQYVFNHFGINIGRTTGDQYISGGEKISNVSDLKNGDIVFFANTYDSGMVDGVSHVGIYAGGGAFVHCSSSKGVTINNLSESYYSQHFLSGLRKDGVSSFVSDNSDESNSKLKVTGLVIKYVAIILLILIGIIFLIMSLGLQKKIGG